MKLRIKSWKLPRLVWFISDKRTEIGPMATGWSRFDTRRPQSFPSESGDCIPSLDPSSPQHRRTEKGHPFGGDAAESKLLDRQSPDVLSSTRQHLAQPSG